jgi:hypothetical protein
MTAEPLVPPVSLPPARVPLARVEFIDFKDIAERREFRLRVRWPDGSAEVRFGIAMAAFGAARVSLQDGPDVCYQKLVRITAGETALAAGETAISDVITIDEAELAHYREAHTPVRKHRSWSPLSQPTPPVAPREPIRRPSPPTLAAPPPSDPAPGLAEGQRVSHAVFGVGVTTASSVGHTAVCFDQGGKKTFVTALLALDVLSAPHTWETSPRGINRPCRAVAVPPE